MACCLFGTKPLFEPMLTYWVNWTIIIHFSEIWIKIQDFSLTKTHLKMLSVQWQPFCPGKDELTHWGRVTHICVSNLTIIGSDNGLSPSWRQAIIWTNAGILLIGPLGTNLSEILILTETFSFKKMHLKVSSVKWRPFCLGLNELMETGKGYVIYMLICWDVYIYMGGFNMWNWRLHFLAHLTFTRQLNAYYAKSTQILATKFTWCHLQKYKMVISLWDSDGIW